MVIHQQSQHAPATPPTRPGRPVRGSALWLARRIVLGVRLALVVLGAVSGVMAAQLEETDIAASNRWTVVLVAAIVAILLGGLVWWVEPSTPPAHRGRERLRTAGRWTRAVLAAAGTGSAFYWIVVDEERLSWFAMAVVAVSPLAYLVFTWIGKYAIAPVWGPPAPGEQPLWRKRRVEHSTAVFAAGRETLFEPERGVLRRALTIRPRPPLTGTAVPGELAAWVRNAVLGTDGTSLHVTGRSGRTYRLPLAAPGSYGAAGLLVVRENVVTTSQYGRSAPRSRELLCVVDSTGRRMLDVELYGWTRSDLVALARAAGLRLDRYAPENKQHVWANRRGQGPTDFEVAVPKASTHRTVRGHSLWRDALPVIVITLVIVAGYYGATEVAGIVRGALTLPEPWLTIVPGLAGAVVIGVLVVAVRALANWDSRRRQAARVRSRAGVTDAP
jgi:hypothetical protein